MKTKQILLKALLSTLTVGSVLGGATGIYCVYSQARANAAVDKHFEVGRDFLQRQEFQLAIKEFDEALHNKSLHKTESSRVLVERGTAYLALNKFTEAINDFNLALKQNPVSELAYINRGVAYFRTGAAHEAIMNFDQALKLNPKSSYALLNRAGAYLLLTPQEAEKLAQKTVDSLEASNWKGEFTGQRAILSALAYKRSGKQEQAKALLETAFAKVNRLPWPYPAIKYLLGKINEETLLEKAQDSTYDLMQAQCYVGIDEMAKGHKKNAKEKFTFVTKHGVSNSVEYWLAKNLAPQLK
jgi:lipoprotein NlpI